MVTPIPDIQYVNNASITWNWARQVIKSNTDISDFSFSSADAKVILKNHILLSQKMAILVGGISKGTSWCCFDFHEIYLKV